MRGGMGVWGFRGREFQNPGFLSGSPFEIYQQIVTSSTFSGYHPGEQAYLPVRTHLCQKVLQVL